MFIITYGFKIIGICIVVVLNIIFFRNEESIDKADYYWSTKIRRKYFKKKNWDEISTFIYLYIVFLFVFCIISYTLFSVHSIWNNTGEFIDVILEIMLSSFLGVFAVVGITTTINKQHYISFNINDILERARIREKIVEMIILIGITFLLHFFCAFIQNIEYGTSFLILKSLILYNFVWFIYIMLYICWNVGDVIFSTTRFELKILDDLYKNYWYNEQPKSSKWYDEGVRRDIEYLLDKYNKYLKKINLKKINKLAFNTTMHGKVEGFAFLEYGVVFYYCLLWYVLIMVLNFICKFDYSYINVFILIFGLYIYFKEIHRKTLMRVFLEKCGYFMTYNFNKVYIHSVPFRRSNQGRYINYLKCILSLYEMLLSKR